MYVVCHNRSKYLLRSVLPVFTSLSKFANLTIELNKKVLLRLSTSDAVPLQEAYRPPCSKSEGGVDRQTDTCENITFPHPSDAVGNYATEPFQKAFHNK